jgi:hypothetical protein
LGLILYFLGWLTKAEASRLAAAIRQSSGALLAGGLALIVTRNIGIAIMAGMLAYSITSRTGWYPGRRQETAAGSSGVRSLYLEMALDHATGAITGRVLRGRFEGRELSGLAPVERTEFLGELHASDPQGAQLFEAYLDRTSPGWSAGAETRSRGANPSRAMTVDEAYMVLGLDRRATRDDVLAAHRNLMKRFHPDQGGSTYLAAQVNEAKEVLLKHFKV